MDNSPVAASERRVIKRYSNRKLYDTRDSRYVTLQQIAEMVRAGEDVQIIDNATKEDKTEVTLALILSEEVRTEPHRVPLGTLRDLIHQRREKLLTQLREGPIGRLIPGAADAGADAAGSHGAPHAERGESKPSLRLQELLESSRQTLDQWQHAMDERIRAVLPSLAGFRDLEAEVHRLAQRVEALEAKLAERTGEGDAPRGPRE